MLNFAAPYVFLLLPLPYVVWRYISPVKKNQTFALKVPFFKALKTIQTRAAPSLLPSLKLSLYGLMAIWILSVIALSGPLWLGKPIALSAQGRDLMLAIDLSGSMELPDLSSSQQQKTRLEVVKEMADPFIANRVGDRIGMVVFGSQAYLQAPLTFDRQTVRRMLADLTIGLAGPQTAMGDALGLALKRLLNSPEQSRAIILLTDGGNNAGTVAPLDAARVAASNHIKIYTIGIGADSLVVPGLFGLQTINPSNDLDLVTLKKIAEMTGGAFFRAKNIQELQGIYTAIDKLEPHAGESSIVRQSTELYPWPLAMAILLSFMLVGSKLRFRP
jgi:Ca-activated chloride channel family protein